MALHGVAAPFVGLLRSETSDEVLSVVTDKAQKADVEQAA